jgi:hypothetical protein
MENLAVSAFTSGDHAMIEPPDNGEQAVVARCPEGPDRCLDDLCRGQDEGMCGALSDRLLGIRDDDESYFYDEDGWDG